MSTPQKPKTYSGDLAHLPPALAGLASHPNWVLWRWEPRKDKDGKIKWTKPPLQPSGAYARNDDPATWCTYEQALDAMETVGADGIGYQLLGEDLAAIDLDDCRDACTGKIDEWAREYIGQAEACGAYVEVTPSGTGFRVIGKSVKPALHCRHRVASERDRAGIEIYRNIDTGRFITISGFEVGTCSDLPNIDAIIVEPAAPEPRQNGHSQDYRANGNGIDRSADLHSEVWRLASLGRTIFEIVQSLRHHPAGDKYGAKLQAELLRSYGKWQEKNRPENPAEDNGPVPVIKSSAEFVAGFVPPDYVVEGLLIQGFIYSLTGATGAGKTAITQRLAASVATGVDFAGRETKKMRVLYLAAENPTDVRMRWIALAQNMGFDENTIEVFFVEDCFSISKMGVRLKEEADRRGGEFGLVIVDTGPVFFEGDDENNRTQMGAHAKMLRGLITLIPGNPCVIVNCHPTKNAGPENLTPAGGGNFLNNIDGNLTAAKTDSTTELHTQGKFRGVDFAPMHFLIQTKTHERLKDTKGRLMPTVICEWISDQRKEAIAVQKNKDEETVLGMIKEDSKISYAAIATRMKWILHSGEPHKTKAVRCVEALEKDKLVKRGRGKLQVTPEGEKVLKGDA
jgi:hypothetical protein